MANSDKAGNQSPPLSGYNAFRLNPLLLQIASGLGAETLKDFDQIGHYSLSADAQDLARLANQNPPVLLSHDSNGNRIDEVAFHPAYHALMRRSVGYGLSSSVWEDAARGHKDGHFKRAVRFFMMAGLEPGHLTSLSSTNGAVAALMTAPHLANEWVPRVTNRKYDSANKSPVSKTCLTLSYGIVEKQAGSDFAALGTRAESLGNGLFRISGHKWVLPSPMADAFLVLARAKSGISCYLVPRYLAENEPNRLNFVSLKDKLGNRSAATASVEINGAIAQMIGEEGRGASIINELLTLTRLDAAVASAGIMHMCLSEAVHHARHRKIGSEPLIEQKLMSQVLGDMAIDVAGCTALNMRVARAFDSARSDENEGAFARIMTPVAKYLSSKRCSALIAETMDVLGANGVMESHTLARYYRDAAFLNTMEGTGNMMAADLATLIRQMPKKFDELVMAIATQLGPRGAQTKLDLEQALTSAAQDEGAARMAIEKLGAAAAGAELARLGTGNLAEIYAETRLSGAGNTTYGALQSGIDVTNVLEALYPPIS